jgi:hypothetical protein
LVFLATAGEDHDAFLQPRSRILKNPVHPVDGIPSNGLQRHTNGAQHSFALMQAAQDRQLGSTGLIIVLEYPISMMILGIQQLLTMMKKVDC